MYKNKLTIWVALILGLALLSGCGDTGPDWLNFGRSSSEPKTPKAKVRPVTEEVEGTVLASINGRTITLEEFNNRIETFNREIEGSKEIPDSMKTNYLIKTAEDKRRLLEGMVERELLIAEAIDRQLDQDKDVIQAIKSLNDELLFVKMVNAERVKVNITSEEVENHYNQYKDAFAIPEERKVSMIVVPSEAKAKEILIRLLQEEDFGTLARESSSDASASSGGNIGFIVRKLPFPQPDKKAMSQKFEEVAFALELNKPSAIFQDEGGFYIIKVVEIKEARQMLLSDVYKDIEQGLLLRKQDEALRTLIGNLRKTGEITMHNELLND